VNFSRQKIFKGFFGGIFQKLNKIQKQHNKLKKNQIKTFFLFIMWSGIINTPS